MLKRAITIINVVLNGEQYQAHVDPNLLMHSLNKIISNILMCSKRKDNPQLGMHFKPKELRVILKDYGVGIPKE